MEEGLVGNQGWVRLLLRCAGCGRKYVGAPSHGRPFYRCAGRDRLAGEERCRVPTMAAARIDAFVWDTIIAILKEPGLLAEKLEAHRTSLGVRQIEVVSEAEYLARRLVEVERQEERLLDAYLDDNLPKALLRKRLGELQGRKAELEAHLAQARRRAAKHEAEAAHQDAVERYCQVALRGLERLTPDGRHQLLRSLVDQIVVRPDPLEIHGILPGRWMPPSPAGKWTDSPNVEAGGENTPPESSLRQCCAVDLGSD